MQSAPEVAFTIWAAILQWSEAFNVERKRIFDQVTPSLLGFSSGSDGFNDWARMRVGVLLPPDFSPDDWLHLLIELAPASRIESASFAIPAYLGEKNNLLVRAFLAAIRKVGGNPGFVLKTGTADLNIVAPAWGCPAVAYGPGDSTLDHTPNEHLSLGEYANSVKVLQTVLLQLCTCK